MQVNGQLVTLDASIPVERMVLSILNEVVEDEELTEVFRTVLKTREYTLVNGKKNPFIKAMDDAIPENFEVVKAIVKEIV